MTTLTAEYVRQRLSYEPETGLFRWRTSAGGVVVGAVAGTPASDGYLQIKIDRRRYLVHRLAWLITHGEWPANMLDHINGDPSDNRIANLRQANAFQNSHNMAAHRDSASGHKGVSWSKKDKRWRAQIYVNRQYTWLGNHLTLEEAAKAYADAAEALQGEFAFTKRRR